MSKNNTKKKITKADATAQTLTSRMVGVVSNLAQVSEVSAREVNRQTSKALVNRGVARITAKGPKDNRQEFIALTALGKKVAQLVEANTNE